MSEDKFQREVLDRLISIETKQDNLIETVAAHTKTIEEHTKEIVRIDAGQKSAHHRIDGIFAVAGIVGATAGAVANFVASIFGRSGHG